MEEDELRDSEAVGKVRETGSSGMVISGILCLFLLQKFPILLAPIPSPLCMVNSPINRGIRPKRDAKAGIFLHDYSKGLGIPNSLMFQVGTY